MLSLKISNLTQMNSFTKLKQTHRLRKPSLEALKWKCRGEKKIRRFGLTHIHPCTETDHPQRLTVYNGEPIKHYEITYRGKASEKDYMLGLKTYPVYEYLQLTAVHLQNQHWK